MKEKKDFITALAGIKLLAMDVDGTMTDGKINIGADGEAFKSFNVKDGLGIRLLKENNIIPAVITTRNSKIVERRALELGIAEVYQGVLRKDETLCVLAEKHGLRLDETAFIGDDVNDMEALEIAGVSFAPSDCAKRVAESVDILLHTKAGEGAVREAIEMILAAL